MKNNTLFYPQATVNTLLDESYLVVKSVYLALGNIKTVSDHITTIVDLSEHLDEIKNVQEAANRVSRVWESIDNIDAIKADINNVDSVATNLGDIKVVAKDIYHVIRVSTNVEDVKTVSNSIEKVSEVADDLDAIRTAASNIGVIKEAPQYAQEAFNSAVLAKQGAQDANESAGLAKRWAVDENAVEPDLYSSRKYAIDSKLAQDESKRILTDSQKVEGYLKSMESVYTSLQRHQEETAVVAGNINSVVNVATDLKGESITDTSKDMGMIGEDGDQGTAVITGGNIKKVADDIKAVRVTADNVEVIKKVAAGLDRLPVVKEELTTISNKTKEDADRAEVQATIATNKAQEATSQTSLASVYANTAKTKAQEASTSEAVVTIKAQEAKDSASRANAAETQASEYKTQASSSAATAVSKAYEANTSATQAKASENLSRDWAIKLDDPVAEGEYSAKYYAQKAKTDGVGAVNTAKTIALSEIATAKTQSVQTVKTQETTSVEEVRKEGSAQVIAATAQAKEAKKQADLAKEYANEAATGQVLADWNEISPASKAFIKNKPDIYTKTEIDSKISAVFIYKGTVQSKSDLPSQAQIGWTYNIKTNGANFTWDGSAWDELGTTVDLTPYATISSVNASLANKLDVSVFDSEKSILQSSIATKLDASSYTTDKPTFALKAEVTDQLGTKANKTDILDMLTKTLAASTYLGIKAKAESAKIADSVAWANVTGKEKVRTTDTPIKLSDFGGPIDLGMIGE